MTSLGCVMIRKPKYALLKLKREEHCGSTSSNDSAKLSSLVKDPFFRRSWLFMFLNISMGLVLIGTCASLLKNVAGLKSGTVIAVMMACGIANGAGRLVFPFISDYMKTRLWIWVLILAIEVAVTSCSAFMPVLLPIGAVLINATYGAAFSTLPSVLNDHYGKDHLSETHGFVLSSWGFASLFAYAVTVLGVSSLPFIALMFVLCSMYAVNLRVVHGMFKMGNEENLNQNK
jgi:OFA family oxalate/formate antiporter-like MFS transporter